MSMPGQPKGNIPILRIFDVEKAMQFYTGFLEFHVDWEHRFDEAAPLYMQISWGGCILHLSEHHGDCCPGAAVRIETEQLQDLHARLLGKAYPYARPGLDTTPWHTIEVCVKDPFGNRIILYEQSPMLVEE